MVSFNPLFKRDFLENPGFQRAGQNGCRGHGGMPTPTVTVSSSVAQSTLSMAYEKMQSAVQSRFPAVAETGAPAEASNEQQDYSPQAVADRIVGFIADRLQQEKANGASDDQLRALYQQALKGVEQGLREGRDIIAEQGLYSGDTKDTYYQTVNLLADGLQQLGEDLFGSEQDAPAEGSGAVSGTGFAASLSQVQVDRSRSFEMEVVTQEGDRVKILVNSGQSFASEQVDYQDANTTINGFDATFSSYDNLSFSVEGDLNESELAALNDLFSQVNDVAATFYGGDVEAAFDQAMSVGMDPEQLASFAVNINQSESVAVRNTYVAVQSMGGGSRFNPYQDMFQQLGDFSSKARHGANAVRDHGHPLANLQSMYGDLLGRLHSDHGRHRGHGDAFQRFANRLAG